ncbi:MAG: RES family NAD+ phosphorylase [Actinobacteria bacterium]|nr:RES family NAD+ phosphorylase [Actinomycetota bacterium]
MISPEELKDILKQRRGISFDTFFYRFMGIEYLKNPLSGLGSLEHGGRYNYFKDRFEVIYLAPDPETATAESTRDAMLITPRAMITIKVTLQKVIDLKDTKVINALGINEQELCCPWRKIQDIDEEKAYTQILGHMIYKSQEFEAIHYPSVQKKGKYNLAIFPERLEKDSELKVYDPDKKIGQVIKGPIANFKLLGS